jgi:uncharacterized Rmd1/YagE family protein
MDRVLAFQIADSIDLKLCRDNIKANLVYSDSDELFYELPGIKFLYIFKYGVVSFFNYGEADIDATLKNIYPYCKNRFEKNLNDGFMVETGAPEYRMWHNKIDITSADRNVLRIIMLNVSQSVTLDYYSEQTSRLLEESNQHTQILEKKGRLAISGRELKKFIGKTLLLKNRIAENLYIFDSPPETWEDEKLDRLYNELKKNFDLQERFRNVSDGLGIVKDNLELFRDIMQHRNTVTLEWIIIALITIEVIHYMVENFI